LVIGVSFWTYNEFTVKRRKCYPGRTCKNEAWFEDQINTQLCEKLHVCKNFTYVFADSWSQTPGPPGFNTDDQLQQDHWQIETRKLWEVTTTRTQRFDFQTIDDILEENARQKREIQQLNDVISNDIVQLNQKVNNIVGNDIVRLSLKVDNIVGNDIVQLNQKVNKVVSNDIVQLNLKVDNIVGNDIVQLNQKVNKVANNDIVQLNQKVNNIVGNDIVQLNLKVDNIVGNDIVQLKQNLVPLGTIIAWVPKPTKGWDGMVDLPDGWVRCDGATIPRPSIWAGQLTPNLNEEKRFLRGAPDSDVLTMEEDQMQNHKHSIHDPKHTHSYDDKYPNYDSNDHGYMGPSGWSDKTNDRFDKSHTRTTVSKATGVTVQGISSGYRHGTETRPKNMNVIYIMKVW